YTVSANALNGFTGTVALSASGLPSGASASFTPTSISGAGSSTLSVTTATSTPTGTHTLTVTGTSGSLAHSANVTLVVNPVGTQPPQPPSNLTATATSSSTINLTWIASPTSGVTYSVFRSTTSGFTPSSSSQLASGVSVTSFADGGLACATTYFYLVEAVNSGGASVPSNQASATTQACLGTQINCGGPAVSPFVADKDFAGGSTINHANTIDLSGVTNPAPMAVYQTARIANFTYTIPGFTAGASHTVRLHFAETFWSTAGSRVFNVTINGMQVLSNFDIFAAAGAKNKAVIEQFTVNANSSGQYVIQFTTVKDNSLVSGIEVQ
ncbi:MAG TPA: malectin domain-containing carbohydrate-binding protein, partial [Candidatus Angelobacter sp.]|nr:malectin domain-containing carbohydrate-binding protein [Candidatus Angelobacter sp.]